MGACAAQILMAELGVTVDDRAALPLGAATPRADTERIQRATNAERELAALAVKRAIEEVCALTELHLIYLHTSIRVS